MENSYTKYLELVEQGKIDPNEPIKSPCFTKQKLIFNGLLGEDNLPNLTLVDSYKAMKGFGLEHEVFISAINYTKKNPTATNEEILTFAFGEWDLL